MPRGRGGRRAPEDRDTQISKKISYILRHGAEKEGLKLDKNGYANCADLLNWQNLRSLKVTFTELRHIVDTNSKKRYEMVPIQAPSVTTSEPSELLEEVQGQSESDDPSQYLIRASQGHSLAISSEALLTPLDPSSADCPTFVVHGTYPQAWKAIQKSGGLSRMGRGHIHFATGTGGDDSAPRATDQPLPEPSAGEGAGAEAQSEGKKGEEEKKAGSGDVIISGLRANATILIWVDVKRSAEAGLKWWRSANGVILTEGDNRGFLKMEWFDRVEERVRGQVSGERKIVWRGSQPDSSV